MPGFVRSDRLEPDLLPRLVRACSDRRREERLGRRATEDEVATVTSCPRLVGHEFSSDDKCHRDRAAARFGFHIDRSLDRIP